MADAKHTLFRGFLGNGSWMLAVHSKRCARQRRRVVSSERVRTLVPNRSSVWAEAARARAAKAGGSNV